MNKSNRDKAVIADAIMSHDRHTIGADEYLEMFGRADSAESMSAEEYRRTHGKTANDFLKNLDSSNVNTETPAMLEFEEWLHYVSPAPVVTEYVFLPDRKFRADWAIPDLGIIFEYDGRTHHATVAGSERDAWKSNLAQLAGWLFIRVNAASLNDGSGYGIAEAAIKQRAERIHR